MNKITFFLFSIFILGLSWQGTASNIAENDDGKTPVTVDNLLIVQLYKLVNYNNNGSVHDSFGIQFDIENDNGLTPQDAIKPPNFFENLGIQYNPSTILSYESREMPQVGEVFTMYSNGYTSTDYVLKMFMTGLEGTVFYMDDAFTNTTTLLGPGAIAYHFSVSNAQPQSKATNRFSIRVASVPTNYVYQDEVWTPNDPSGVATSSDNILIINGMASLIDNTTVHDITINSGATLEINNVLNLKGDLTNNGDLVFISNELGNGELGEVSLGSIITGNATVQRYMSSNRSYRMVSSAVTTSNSIHANWQEGATSNTDNPLPGFGTHITGSTIDQQNGFDGTETGNASMFTVNVGTQQFQAIANTNSNSLTAGEAYLLFVRGDRSIDLGNNSSAGETVLRATGSLVTGTQTQDYATVNADDLVMFGNPYQSAVNVNSVVAGSTNLNTNQYYIYDPTLADHGAYVTVELATGNNSSGSSANQYLQPGQGAQIATVAAGASSVVFKETDKATGQFTTSNRNSLIANDMLTVQLFTKENFDTNGGSVHDSFAILFAEENNNDLTPTDAVKPMNFYENLGIDHNGTYLSIERREMPESSEIYQLYSAGYTHSEYTLHTTVYGLEGTSFYLDDTFTGTSTLLETGDTTYTFRVDASEPNSLASNRFTIRTEQRLHVDENNMLSDIQLFPNPLKGGAFYIQAPKWNGEQLSVRIHDLMGRIIYVQTLECTANTIAVPMAENLARGVYVITLNHGGQTHSYRLIKE